MFKLWSKKSPSFVGIRISDNSIKCSLIEQSEHQQLKCVAIESVPLTTYEVVNGRIFNHKKINSIIWQFIHSYNQHESYIVISCDDSLAKNNENGCHLNCAPHILFHFSLFAIAHKLKCIALTTHKGALNSAEMFYTTIHQQPMRFDELIEDKNHISQSLLLEAIGLFAIGKQSYEEGY